jgi:hypothetical protein
MAASDQLPLPFDQPQALAPATIEYPSALPRHDPAPRMIPVENLRAIAPSGAPGAPGEPSTASMMLSAAGAAVGAYHFTRRHRGSLAWGLAGGVLGALFPIAVPVITIAQGFGKPLPARAPDDTEEGE